jgi:NTP pyrophosphatase (non-canonical NTP hydrolase)
MDRAGRRADESNARGKRATIHHTPDGIAETPGGVSTRGLSKASQESRAYVEIAGMAVSDAVGLSEFQRHTLQTDRNPREGLDGLALPLLGLFGEVGSLLSELKKKQRDTDSYIGYADSVVEELGDVLWYFANVASRLGLDLPVLGQRAFDDVADSEIAEHGPETFGDLQRARNFSGPLSTVDFERGLIALAGKVGRLMDDVASGLVHVNSDAFSAHLVTIFRALVRAANHAGVSLDAAARQNIEKTLGRWPTNPVFGPRFDADADIYEQLPALIEMEMIERSEGDRVYVLQRCKGINIGDRITDNRLENDDYRFHDVFHLGYAAILGWSPVVRALFKVKRKSKPKIDETQDGARAILIEEGVSTWVFNHATRMNYFAGVSSLDFSLLKAVRGLVSGYEVEQRPLWQWERAILEGYKAFRELRARRKGLIVADLTSHTLTFRELQ